MTSIIISVVALVFAVAALAYSVNVALVYHRFNEQIADWSRELDESMRDALFLASRNLLRELDSRIEEDKDNNNTQTQDKECMD